MNFLQSALRPHGREQVHDLEKDGISGNTSPYPSALPPLAHRATVLEPQAMEQLNTFRHMVGIHSTKGFLPQILSPQKGGFLTDTTQNNLHFDGRAAPNVGIYNRVCHRESQAKRGFKFATLFINGCLGLQIIVAAALTAMGAANSNHVGITAFGAINTVIAGILTYLKGSGLPNRIRYYENEWKRVREFIEQRERDFSRQGCMLNLEETVKKIEDMYEQVKADIQTNTPDSYVSIGDVRARATATLQNANKHAPSQAQSKFEELELKYGHKVTDLLESLAHKEEERLKRLEGDISSRATAAKTQWQHDLDDAKVGARDWTTKTADRELDHARGWEQSMQDKSAAMAARELEHARGGMLARGLSFAKDLEHTKADVLQRSGDVARGLDRVKDAAVQQGREYQAGVSAKTARFVEQERELEREAERTRDAAIRAQESLQRAGDSVQRAGDSVGRVAGAVDDEIQLHRRE